MSIQSAKIKYDILKISEEARLAKIKDSSVINATIGAYYNENNEFKAFKTVKGIINSLDDVDYYSYATSDGGAPYESAVISWVFKNRRKNVLNETNVRAVSTVGRIFGVVTSVTHALKAASLLAEPIKVITISIRMTTHTVAPRIFASSEMLSSDEIPSLVINPKDAVTRPHNK